MAAEAQGAAFEAQRLRLLAEWRLMALLLYRNHNQHRALPQFRAFQRAHVLVGKVVAAAAAAAPLRAPLAAADFLTHLVQQLVACSRVVSARQAYDSLAVVYAALIAGMAVYVDATSQMRDLACRLAGLPGPGSSSDAATTAADVPSFGEAMTVPVDEMPLMAPRPGALDVDGLSARPPAKRPRTAAIVPADAASVTERGARLGADGGASNSPVIASCDPPAASRKVAPPSAAGAAPASTLVKATASSSNVASLATVAPPAGAVSAAPSSATAAAPLPLPAAAPATLAFEGLGTASTRYDLPVVAVGAVSATARGLASVTALSRGSRGLVGPAPQPLGPSLLTEARGSGCEGGGEGGGDRVCAFVPPWQLAESAWGDGDIGVPLPAEASEASAAAAVAGKKRRRREREA